MLKVIGILLLAACPMLFGLLRYTRCVNSIRQLEAMLWMVTATTQLIEYEQLSLDDIMLRLCKEKQLAALQLPEWKRESGSFFKRVTEYFESNRQLCISERDKAFVIDFYCSLGNSDVESQLVCCNRFYSQLEQRLYEQRQSYVQRGKLYLSLGTLGGAAVAILLI